MTENTDYQRKIDNDVLQLLEEQNQNQNQNQNKDENKNKTCAPNREYEGGSCASLYVLRELANAYNYTAQPIDKIKLSSNVEVLNPQKYKAYLVYQLNMKIKDECGMNQKCWSKQNFIKNMEEKAREELTKYTFRPNSPQGQFEWLSTFDINNALQQYYVPDKGFKFFGAVPMDFAELNLEISNCNYDSYYKKGFHKLGVVFNLDNHDQPGSHWTAMYTDLNKGCIYYFDSFGIKPEQRVRSLMKKQVNFLDSIGKKIDDIKIDYNKIQHQKGNTECGVYSINFLIKMAKGEDFNEYCNKINTDKQINKCRKVYFNNQK